MPFSYYYSFANGPGPWKTWMAPSVHRQLADGGIDFTRFRLSGTLDPNHIDGIGPIWLLAHLSLPDFGAPGALNLSDATIKVTIRSKDLEANGTKLGFWMIRYIPNTDISENYFVGLEATNWAYTGVNILDQFGDEWVTISVNMNGDPKNWTEAGNYQSRQGDWAQRYNEYALADTLTNVDATLHLVFIGDDPGNPPQGFIDIANIEIITQTPAIPLQTYDYAMVLQATEDTPLTGALDLPVGIDQATAHYSLVTGSARYGTVTIDADTGVFTFTPNADFWGPDRNGTAAQFQYQVADINGTSSLQSVYVYVAPINDTPIAFGGREGLTIQYQTTILHSLRSGNDPDVGETLKFDVDQASIVGGTLTLDPDTGRYSFAATAGFSGAAGFSYRVTDGQVASAYKAVVITVLPQGESYGLPSFDDIVNDYLIPGDIDSWVQWTIRLAEAGDTRAAYYYGTWLQYGEHVNRDAAEAVQLLTSALGETDLATLQLAELMISGTGTPKNSGAAYALLLDINHNPRALYLLGTLTELGLGTPADATKAAEFYRLAAKMGDADALYTLGRRYLAGDGVPVQAGDAYFFLGLGLRLNGGPPLSVFDQLLEYNMEQAAANLTSEQIATLDIAIASWAPGFDIPGNDAPELAATPETNATLMNVPVAGALLFGTDIDADIPTFELLPGSEVGGTVDINPETGAYQFTPYLIFHGTAGFQYRLTDGQAVSSIKTITIAVTATTFAVADGSQAGELQSIAANAGNGLLANDITAAGAAGVTVVAVNGLSILVGVPFDTGFGTLTINANGSYSFVANAETLIEGQAQILPIDYTIADNLGNESSGSLSIVINGEGGTVINGSGTLWGSPFNDRIAGGEASDTLLGYGGDDILAGGTGAANTLQGGTGDDSYYVSTIGESVVEFVNEGTDKVIANVSSYTLPLHVEHLIYGGTSDFNGTGNALNNAIVGGSGNDILSGGSGSDLLVGGAGDDILIGGVGNDRFLISSLEGGIVRILDFSSGEDQLLMSTKLFENPGIFSYQTGSVASGAGPAFLYDPVTGIVRYDGDGAGGKDAVPVAHLNGGLTPTIDDFGFFI